MIWQGLLVEIIRILWDHGYYNDNVWLQRVHDNYFSYWVDYKTQQTMQSVDEQIEELIQPAAVDKPVFSETLEGETLLGGEMRLTAPWHSED